MAEKRQEFFDLIDKAYNTPAAPKFNDLKKKLLKYAQELNAGDDYIKIMLSLRYDLFHADRDLNLVTRISGLPDQFKAVFYFIEPQVKKIDEKTLRQYNLAYGLMMMPIPFGGIIG
ncbi:hypothetical protein FC83_GL000674 [Agrilactobacillus composti DSM 18527 = JCM 14202]|uniref:Bacteriocin immunity protein n=1 Tax=Agrilactobacillus composti DSM 18527 = JCM 14202 TaxID=1423734 RepID=X0PDQ4_9LACO|nr:bacteriocin immunity protein [Agrilactobacillus composti]KRM31610.1 hypothetical protein FC83_GL000674 [Agrilactobacillus composti DSM 18527 = JCM 14202]GAF39359.1 hypothetical protein JCM14202_1217 [Agrilactobacillus composti DSM 18527 = JCM 14202]